MLLFFQFLLNIEGMFWLYYYTTIHGYLCLNLNASHTFQTVSLLVLCGLAGGLYWYRVRRNRYNDTSSGEMAGVSVSDHYKRLEADQAGSVNSYGRDDGHDYTNTVPPRTVFGKVTKPAAVPGLLPTGWNRQYDKQVC